MFLASVCKMHSQCLVDCFGLEEVIYLPNKITKLLVASPKGTEKPANTKSPFIEFRKSVPLWPTASLSSIRRKGGMIQNTRFENIIPNGSAAKKSPIKIKPCTPSSFNNFLRSRFLDPRSPTTNRTACRNTHIQQPIPAILNGRCSKFQGFLTRLARPVAT
jgi:hypothetical protein